MADEDEVIDAKISCNVCGEKKVVVRAGYQYCVECGTRSQDTQPTLDFTLEIVSDNLKLIKVAKRKSKKKVGETWSTWHAHNMILLGLVEEVSCCGGVQEDSLKSSCLKIWGHFLKNKKIAFFERKMCAQPKLPFRYTSRDLNYLYGVEQLKKSKKKITENTNEITNDYASRGLIRQKKSKFLKQQFQDFITTQTSDVPAASQTLTDLKNSEQFVKSSKISVTKKTKLKMKKNISVRKIEKHIKEGLCGPKCRCFEAKPTKAVNTIKDKLSIVNLYAILILALRINEDMIQVGDIIRWCREGHLSFGKYTHFFPFDMLLKNKDKRNLSLYQFKLQHFTLRKVAGGIAQSLKFKSIKPPNISSLILRYIKELELPLQLYDKAKALYAEIEPLGEYVPEDISILPNYEAIAMSYIVVTLKLLFGLDDKTEYENSCSVAKINDYLSFPKKKKDFLKDFDVILNHEKSQRNTMRLFNWNQWMEYIEYRKVCLSEYHYPTRMQFYPGDCDKPELFLHHKNICKKNAEEVIAKNQINDLLKSLLERVEDSYIPEESFPTFYCSINPMLSYVETLLTWKPHSEVQYNREILEEDFSAYDTHYVFNAEHLKKSLKKLSIELLLISNKVIRSNAIISDVNSRNVNMMDYTKDIEIKDCLQTDWMNSLNTTSFFHHFDKLEAENFSKDKIVEFDISLNDKKVPIFVGSKSEKCLKINLCYKKYWIHHYNSKDYLLSDFMSFSDKLPHSFSWLLKECGRIIEAKDHSVYVEVCKLEKKLMQKLIISDYVVFDYFHK